MTSMLSCHCFVDCDQLAAKKPRLLLKGGYGRIAHMLVATQLKASFLKGWNLHLRDLV